MTTPDDFEIFLVAAPGLEPALCMEARSAGFTNAAALKGGVAIRGTWRDVWRANLELRGAGRVLARIGSFRALHLAQLDKRARKVGWDGILRRDVPFRVEATCSRSKIYHSGAATERIERAIRETLGAKCSDEAGVVVKARIEDDLCTLAVDTSGAPLHKRGHKEAVAKAPMRETLAALFLRQCGYVANESLVDPMCGSGTFVIEAAEIAAGLKPGRTRRFAFEQLATFDAAEWERMRASSSPITPPETRFFGSDRDAGAIRMSRENAARAQVSEFSQFEQRPIDELDAPDVPPGLVIVNPPYGDRIGGVGGLEGLYRTLGQTLQARFKGWRVGLVTNDAKFARATGLAFKKPDPPVSHGGIRVTLYRTDIL